MWKILQFDLQFDLLLGFPRDLLSDLVLTYFDVLGLVSQFRAQGFLNSRLCFSLTLHVLFQEGKNVYVALPRTLM